MADIVEILRRMDNAEDWLDPAIVSEAADLITRLRAEVEELRRAATIASAYAFGRAAQIAYSVNTRDKTAIQLQLYIVDAIRKASGEDKP